MSNALFDNIPPQAAFVYSPAEGKRLGFLRYESSVQLQLQNFKSGHLKKEIYFYIVSEKIHYFFLV